MTATTSAGPPAAAAARALTVEGPSLALRYPTLEDAPALFELGSDPAVTRFFSWGPYRDVAEAEAYVEGLAAKRERGELLEFLVVHREDGPVGITGLSELSRRDRRAIVGSWLGHRWWGTGVNAEAKALVTALAFGPLGLERLTALAGSANGRSQVALERLGFRREGVLRAYHRHGDRVHDVVVFGLLRAAWERSPLARVPVQVSGEPPAAWQPSAGPTPGAPPS